MHAAFSYPPLLWISEFFVTVPYIDYTDYSGFDLYVFSQASIPNHLYFVDK